VRRATLYGVVIAELLFDDENEGKLASHAISVEQAWQVLDNPYVLEPNRRGRRADYLLIGRDDGGACIALPVERTIDPVIWRPVTGWYCKRSELARLNRRLQRR
jgi:hypothetical protein